MKRISYLEDLNAEREVKRYSAEEIQGFLEKVLVIDTVNSAVVWALCLYFSGDQRFEGLQNGFDLKKGLCLFGGVGVGKTTLMEKFFRNQRQSFTIRMCRQVEDEFAQRGDVVLREYAIAKPSPHDDRDPYGHQVLGYCFDDLGTEPPSMYYGKKTDVMAEVLLNRYDRRVPRIQTHITTNLSTDEIFTRYGSRVSDRMQEMFNMIVFPTDAKSRRV